MNNIKRKNKKEDNLLTYKFGDTNADTYSKKILKTSKINKRIILEEFILHDRLSRQCPNKIIELLISKERVDIVDDNGCTPLYIALANKYSDKIVEMIIESGSLSIKKYVIKLAEKNNYPYTIIDLMERKK